MCMYVFKKIVHGYVIRSNLTRAGIESAEILISIIRRPKPIDYQLNQRR